MYNNSFNPYQSIYGNQYQQAMYNQTQPLLQKQEVTRVNGRNGA
jgi:hypothetical protein